MGFKDDTAKKIEAANAKGDVDEAARLLAHYLLESDMDRADQQSFMSKLDAAAREK